MEKTYCVRLAPKSKKKNALPYSVSSIWVDIKGENLIDACDRAEGYLSAALGISMITESACIISEEETESDEIDE